MQQFYGCEDRREEQRLMMQLRVEYQRKAYPGLSAALAWIMEQQADVILRHLGYGAKMSDSDCLYERELMEQVGPIFEESLRILGLMFGTDHEHYTRTERKYGLAKSFL